MSEKTGADLITEERERQIDEEGWTAEHDAAHCLGQLSTAGAAYALDVVGREDKGDGERGYWEAECLKASIECWPWDGEWWKPTPEDPIRQLTKAGALIAAEIDRIQRADR